MQHIDELLLLWFNGGHTDFLDRFMWIFTGRFVWIPFYAALFVMMWRAWGWRRALVLTLCVGACVALADQICASLLRPLFCRPRPSRPDSPIVEMVTIVRGYRGGHYGFPSCHGANSFALAAAMILIVRQWRFTLMILTWACVNCLTRLYLGVHYPGDILAGAAVGITVSLLIMPQVLRRVKVDARVLRPFPSAADIPSAVFLVTAAVIAIISLRG